MQNVVFLFHIPSGAGHGYLPKPNFVRTTLPGLLMRNVIDVHNVSVFY